MQGEDNYVITISNTEAEVIKKFVSIIDNATVSIDNDDVWDIMTAITYKRTSTNVVGVKIMYAVSYTHLTLPTN